jgi:hypothetical protein
MAHLFSVRPMTVARARTLAPTSKDQALSVEFAAHRSVTQRAAKVSVSVSSCMQSETVLPAGVTAALCSEAALQLTWNRRGQKRKRMWSGDRPGLQNRRVAGFPVTGGFDSHSLPPFFRFSARFESRCGMTLSPTGCWPVILRDHSRIPIAPEAHKTSGARFYCPNCEPTMK